MSPAERVSLKPLQEEDAERLFSWRNDPFIANLGSLQRRVTWEEHLHWIYDTLKLEKREAYIIHIDSQPAGQVRFDFDNQDNTFSTISIYLIEGFVGRGFGAHAIINACLEHFNSNNKISRIFAHVRANNTRGAQGFIRAGFIAYPVNLLANHNTFIFYRPDTKKIPHNRLTFDNKEAENVSRIILTGYWAGGKEVEEIESKVAKICRRKYAVAVSSGIGALRLSLLALGIKEGKEIHIPAYSCVALPNAILSIGATPSPIDIDPHLNISSEELQKKISSKSSAVIAVNTFGYPAEIASIKKTNLPIIEDCSHGFGNGLGSQGHISIISFYATKFIGGGEGGMVLTDDVKIFEAVKDLRDYTDKTASKFRLNDKMSDIHAAVINAQLVKLPQFIERRKNLAEKYLQRLSILQKRYPEFHLPTNREDRIWYRFTLLFSTQHLYNYVSNYLADKSITACKPIENWMSGPQKVFPSAGNGYENILSIPLYPSLTDNEQQYIINSIETALISFYHG